MEIDDLKEFVETIYDFDTPGLIPLCMVHTIWYLLRCPPQKITLRLEETPKLHYMLPSSRDMIYESIKSMFTEKEQPIPALTSYAFERSLELLHSSVTVGYIAKKSKTGATIILPPTPQNPDVEPDSDTRNPLENICWILFEEYDKAKVDELINYCADDLDSACKGAEIYSWNEVKDEKLRSVFLDKLDPNKLNKLKITDMIELTEDYLRRLLVKRYEKHVDWTRKKEFVPPGIISKMYTEDCGGFRGYIDKKADDASNFGGKIRVLSPVQAFVNACTLGEAMKIIEYRKRNFTEKKNKETKKLEGGPFKEKDIQHIIDNFEELKKIRDKRFHFDEQLTWGVEMVEKTKVLTDAIIWPIENYLNK